MSEEFVESAVRFISAGQKTGLVLDTDSDRSAAQALLDYWATLLLRAGKKPPEAALQDFQAGSDRHLEDKDYPYADLGALTASQDQLFTGWRRLIKECVARLRDNRMLAVVGPSGSGRTSLVQAGLLPLLKEGELPESEKWHYYPMFAPAPNPVAKLAALTRPPDRDEAEWAQQQSPIFRQNPGHLAELVNVAFPRPAVLVVDSFDGVFTRCTKSEREQFIDNLLGLVKGPNARHYVILVMRSDAVGRVAEVDSLHQVFQNGLVFVRFDPAELRQAIEEPAKRVGLKFDEGLVDQLVRDVQDDAAAVTLLQFTLRNLWQEREGNRITWDAYRRSGGGRRAVELAAEDLYNHRLSLQEREAVKPILLQMVRPEVGFASRAVSQQALYQTVGAPPVVDQVLRKLEDARLVRVQSSQALADPQITVAQEALLGHWSRLVEWLEEERDLIRRRARLRAAAEQWVDKGKHADDLWSGSSLKEALEFKDLSGLDEEFIRASQTAQSKRTWIRRGLIALGICTAVVVIALIIFILLLRSWNAEAKVAKATAEADKAKAIATLEAVGRDRAEKDARIQKELNKLATSRQLAAQAVPFFEGQLDLALLLSLEACQTHDTVEARSSLLSGLQASPRLAGFLHGHKLAVFGVAFSSDGKILASAGADGTIRLWEVASRRQLGELPGHKDVVRCLAISPDGKMLASGGVDETVILWDIHSKKQVGQPLAAHKDMVRSLAFSSNSRTLASGSWDNTIILWDIATRKPLFRPLRGHKKEVTGVAFSHYNTTLASSSADNTIILWDVRRGEAIGKPIIGATDCVNCLAFNSDGKILAAGSADSKIRLWNVTEFENPRFLYALAEHTDFVSSLAFSSDGNLLASAGGDQKVIIWDLTTRAPRGRTLTNHTDAVWTVAFSKDSQMLASGGGDGKIILWDVSSNWSLGSPLGDAPVGHTDAISSIAISPDGRTLASGGVDGKIILWDSIAREPLGPPLTGHVGRVWGVAFSPDGTKLASAGADRSVIVWDVDTRRPLGSPLAGHRDAVTCVAFHPDGQSLATGSADEWVIRWQFVQGMPVASNYIHQPDAVLSLAFNKDGSQLATSCADKSINLWDTKKRTPITPRFPQQNDVARCLAFSPDGKLLATASREKITLWDFKTHQAVSELPSSPVAAFAAGLAALPVSPPGISPASLAAILKTGLTLSTGHEEAVRSLAFSPDSRVLASGGWDKAVILWDVAMRLPIKVFADDHQDSVLSVAFNPSDSNILASGSVDKTIRLWDVAGRRQNGSPLNRIDANDVVLSLDGTTLVCGMADGNIATWDIAQREPSAQFPRVHTASVDQVAISPDGKMLASGGTDQIVLWDFDARVPLDKPLKGHNGFVSGLAFSPDGTKLVSSGGDQRIVLWDVRERKEIREFLGPVSKTHRHGPDYKEITLVDVSVRRRLDYQFFKGNKNWGSNVALSPDGKILAASCADYTVRRWDVATGQPIGQSLVGHTDLVWSVAFGPDGMTLASGGADKTIRLWNLQDGKPVGAPLIGHTDTVYSMAFSSDGKTLASGGADKMIILWDVETRRRIGEPFTGHLGSINGVAFDQKGKGLISAGGDGSVMFWDVDLESWKKRALRIANRPLTQDERRSFRGLDVPYQPESP
jgi:WD40 repeat protein